MKYLLIVNPISGTENKEKIVDTVLRVLSGPLSVVNTVYTSYKGHAFNIALNAKERCYDAVIAVGGDGTVNEIGAAAIKTGIPMGIIPCGSGNGLARHLGISVDPAIAAKTIRNGNIVDCDYGLVNSHPFFCTSGIGFDAKVSEAFAKNGKRGPKTYIQSIITELTSFKASDYTIVCKDMVYTHKAFIIAICNASQYGNNAYISPYASITDGFLDMTVISPGNPLQTVSYGIDVMTGRLGLNPNVHSYRGENFSIIRTGCTLIHIDGDPMVIDGTISYSCHKGGLKIFSSGETIVKPLLAPWETA